MQMIRLLRSVHALNETNVMMPTRYRGGMMISGSENASIVDALVNRIGRMRTKCWKSTTLTRMREALALVMVLTWHGSVSLTLKSTMKLMTVIVPSMLVTPSILTSKQPNVY